MNSYFKQAILVMAICLSMINSQAQTVTQFIGTPADSFGYLIWVTDESKVQYYQYEYIQTAYDDGVEDESIIARGEIWRQNYLLVPYEYFKPADPERLGFSIRLIGVDHNNTIIPDETVTKHIGGYGQDNCYWTCHSTNWAYRIQQRDFDNGTRSFTLKMAYETEEEGYQVPFYRYFSQAEYESYTAPSAPGSGDPSTHNLNCWPFPGTSCGNTNPDAIMVLENTSNAHFYDNTGSEIFSSVVYAIQKGFGPWYPTSPSKTNSTADYCEATFDPNLQTMMNFMNEDLPSFFQPLTCPTRLGGYSGEIQNEDEEDPEPFGGLEDNGPCHNVFVYGPEMTFQMGYTAFYSHHIHCERETNPEGQNNSNEGSSDEGMGDLAEDIMNCEVYKVVHLGASGAETLIQGGASSFVTADGSPNIPTHSFQPGLHRVTIKLPNEPQKYMVFDVKEAADYTVEHKDFFSGSIFPNPHQDDHFFITIQTSARLTGKYELFDANANVIHRQTFIIPKDHSNTHRIDPNNPLPSGFLYHKFTFEDGSTKTYTTIR